MHVPNILDTGPVETAFGIAGAKASIMKFQ